MVSDYGMISFEPCAFVGPSHECTASVAPRIWVLGRDNTSAGESLVVDTPSIEYWETVFEEKQERLKHQKEDIEANLKNQRMQPGKIARKEVEEWLEKVGQQIGIKVEGLINQGECSSSTNLNKNIEELKQTLEQGKEFTNTGVSLVIDDHSIKGVPLLVEECRGRDDIQDQILEWLKGDEVTRIVVSGMGGVGKTTIMKQVHNLLLKEPQFNKVIWVKVARDFDIIVQQKKKLDILKFQKRIASSLELKLEPEDHENEIKLAGLISQKLRQDNSVLILDDVWQQFCLEDVEIPILDGNNGCKLVLTTQLQQDVARAMECEVISVNPLPPEKALALFLEKVGSAVLSSGRIKGDIDPFLKQILQKCDGVPLAVVTVAKTMRGKLDPRSWKEESIECWIDEGFIYKEGETRDTMNCEGHVMLEKLVDNCLLESIKNRRVDCMSMHDLFREMSLDIRPQFLVKAGIALEKLPKEHEWREDLLKVSLMSNYITEIPSSMPPPKCPMLTTLLLSNNRISTISKAFFEHMLGLKILDLSNNHKLTRLLSSVSKLENLTTLLLRGTSVEELPQGLNMLKNLKYLGLGGRLSETLDELLQNLSKLQHLLVIADPEAEIEYKWETIGIWGKLQNLEKLDLGYLDNLNMVFGEVGAIAESTPLPAGTFSFLQHINVWRCDKIKKLFLVRWLGYLQKLQTIEVINCEQLEEIIGSESEEGEKVTLPKLERLEFTGLPQLKTIYSGSSLQHINVWRCGFNSLSNLEYLHLRYLWNLKCVFDEEVLGISPLVPPTSFLSFKEIRVEFCDQLKKVFSSGWLLRYFQSLETIDIKECLQMEELISSSAHEEEKVTLPKLQSLQLFKLPALKSICNRSSVLICDSIQSLKIAWCKKLKRIPLIFPLLDKAQSSHPPSLKEIVVSPKKWWESLEWDHSNAKDILLPLCKFELW
ncbi:hypothetical protein SLEP1_g41103 [Rubroshorea leprosula]|uniref:NB-ARC domain-containing protein n=1 Tax=Rubroshorea leprosula TaxID=152421 RepID=A0AAV5L5W7_9ROSI|nr:hypothetical protein SLEP1_g41103 [Rubroshorea leprosula]